MMTNEGEQYSNIYSDSGFSLFLKRFETLFRYGSINGSMAKIHKTVLIGVKKLSQWPLMTIKD